ncbi:MAG TPA: hypothetical protein VGN51_04880 [Acidimicrobiia bacterium]
MPCDALRAEGPVIEELEAEAWVRPLPRLELALRLALTFAIAYQVIQRFTYTGYGMSEYGRSLWYVTYEHGFVRRGLAGEVLRTIVGGRPTIATVDLVQNVVAVATVGAMVALVVVLARRRTIVAYAAAGALVVAPFAFDSIGGQRRPDLLAFLLLALVGLWAGTRAVVPTRMALVAGALLAVCTLASEVAPLIVAPWLVLVVIAATRARSGPTARIAIPTALCIGPSVLVVGALMLHGPPSAQQVFDLELAAPNIIEGHGSVFEYLGDTFGSSFQRVIERSHPELSILVGLALVAVLVAVFRGPLPYVTSLVRWLLPRRVARVAWVVATASLTTALFALGFDWLRWITVIAFAALLALAGVVAIDGRARHPSPARDEWHRAVPDHVTVSGPGIVAAAVATYLVVLPPLPNFVSDVMVGVRLLLDVPQ